MKRETPISYRSFEGAAARQRTVNCCAESPGCHVRDSKLHGNNCWDATANQSSRGRQQRILLGVIPKLASFAGIQKDEAQLAACLKAFSQEPARYAPGFMLWALKK